MTEIRIDAATLPLAFQEALARLSAGDEVLLEEAGVAVARLQRCDTQRAQTNGVASMNAAPSRDHRGSIAAWLADRAAEPPVDDEFENHVLEAIAWGNQPAEPSAWER